jgi:hypothetical protein
MGARGAMDGGLEYTQLEFGAQNGNPGSRGPMSAKRVLTLVGVAALFASCGAGSSLFVFKYGHQAASGLVYPLAFPLLCALLFMRTRKAFLACPLMIATGLVAAAVTAYLILAALMLHISSDAIPVLVGGATCGVGVTLSCAVPYRQLLSRSRLLGAALVGGLAALPFSSLVAPFGRPDPRLVVLAFAIWEAAVGTYLYAICTSTDQEPGDSSTSA